MSRPPVQARGGGYGLDAELARRAAERYDYEMEDEARAWIEAVSGMAIGDEFGEGLRDGVILCTLVNKIHPDIVKRIETKSKMPFKLMENVSSFLRACRTMGVSEFDLFETVDLFELKDLGHVVRCIFALGRAVQKTYPDFNGPTLGVKESVKNERTFTEEKLNEARAAPSLVNLGSFRTMERLDVSRGNSVTFGAEAATSFHRAPPPPPPPSEEKVEFVSQVRAGKAFFDHKAFFDRPAPVRAQSESVASRFGSSWSPAKPEKPTGSENPEDSENVAQLANAIEQVSVEEPAAPIASSIPGLSPAKQTGPTPEEEAQEWIESVLNEKFLTSFGDSLKDGVMLCTLMNKIRPGIISRIQTSSMPFKQMENITAFLKACRSVGVAEFDLFETVDLFELKKVDLVVKCIHALGRAVQKNVPEFDGPSLGAKIATTNKRSFTDAQIKEAAAAVPILAHGSSQVMERKPFDRSASVTFGFDAAISGRDQRTESSPVTIATVKEEAAPAPTPAPAPAHIPAPASASSTGDSSDSASKSSHLPKSVLGGSALPTRTVWS
uniref:Calponin-homology (CH) domain-containing protein n=1 Tax=Globisporangium ultimum (strain ATCC 200006 / CBS 805.95 / DAOM BR144) TaxID=431595 RepID=K3WZS5_GLOUD